MQTQREAEGTDEQIVARVLSGQEHLFETLVRRYQTRILSHVARMVGSREDALDLSQEIFLKVFGALDRFNPEFRFSTWLFRIAGNAAIDHLRKRKPRTIPLETTDSDGHVSSPEYKSSDLDPLGRLRNTERGDAITRAIADLPAEFRELIALRHFTGLSYEEIAGIVGISVGTVKSRIARARESLRSKLGEDFKS